MRRILLILLFFLNLPVAVAQEEDSLSKLKHEISKIQHQHRIAGITFILSNRDDVEHIVSMGVTDHESGNLLTPRHYIRLGSVSKLFLGMTMLRLQAQGKLDLNQPLSNHLKPPPLTNRWSHSHPVTVAQLLEHTAGLTDMTQPEWDSKTRLSLSQAFAIDPSSRLLKWPPGLHSSYSNSGAGVASHAIETVTGKFFEDVVEQELFSWLGLASATYELTPTIQKDLMTGYNTDGVTPIPYWHTLYRAFAGINVRAQEMATVLNLLLNNGRLEGIARFTAKDMARMHTPTTTVAARSGLNYGYGLGLYQYNHKGFPMIGHGGDADGYLTHIAYSENTGKGFFVVFNAFNYRAMRQIKTLLHDVLIRGATVPDKPEVIQLSIDQMDQLSGEYESITHRFPTRVQKQAISIFRRGQKLYTRHEGNAEELIAVTATHFRRNHEPVATIAIVTEGNETYLQSDAGNFKRHGE